MSQPPNYPPNPQQPPPGWQPGQQPYGQQPQGPQYPGPPQPPYGHPQYAQQPPPPPPKAPRPWYKLKRTWLIAVIALLVIVGIANGGKPATVAGPGAVTPTTGGSEPTNAPATTAASKASEPTKTQPPKPKMPGIGDKVKAGDWAFKVTSIKCGAKRVGTSYLHKNAQGQFCLLNIRVTNNGDDAQTLIGDNQHLIDGKGRTFSSDDEASIYVDPDHSVFAEQINPGNTLKGVVVFDIPKHVKPVEADLAGGIFGVKDRARIDVS